MKTNQLRIIGGKWRGRKITFPNITGLRPTHDRVRETLFNWLAPVIAGARCLDLFCGSGALGLEALSRGAGHVVMVDQSLQVIKQLMNTLKILNSHLATLHCTQIPDDAIFAKQLFDIVFLDPPFHQDLINQCSHWLENKGALAPNAYIYIETEATLKTLLIPDNWKILQEKKAGQVKYYLVQRGNEPNAD